MGVFVDEPLFAAWASAAGRYVGDFRLQDLANTAWAFAMGGLKHEPLFAE